MGSKTSKHPSSQIRVYDRTSSVVFLKTKEEFGGLSNMAGGFPLVVNDIPIRTSEALYQACRFPHLPDVQKLIIDQRSPMTAKMKGKPYRHDSRSDWNKVRINVMRWCLRVKLVQNWTTFGRLLLETNSRPIVEQSRKDDFWGAKPVDEDTLVGMNVLGRLLMELRESVKTEPPETFGEVRPLRIHDFLLYGHGIELVRAASAYGSISSEDREWKDARTPVVQSHNAQVGMFDSNDDRGKEIQAGRRGGSVNQGSGTRKLAPYSSYREADIEWMGEVPSHWEVCRLKRICRFAYGDSLADGERRGRDFAVYGSNGIVGWHESANTVGPTVVVGRKGSFGKVNYSSVPVFAIDTTFFVDRRFMEGDIRWLSYLLDWLRLDETSKDSAVPGLGREEAYRCLAPLPPQSEQTAIARFLDHATSRIDRCVQAKEKLVATLDEYRQALVHESVTGQIDVRTGRPYPVYRDSRFGRVGSVPTHWMVPRLKSLVTRIDQGVSPQAENHLADGSSWGVLKAGCANGGTFREDQHKRLPIDFEFDPDLAIADGDILVSRANGSPHLVGSTARVVGLSYDLILSDKTFRPIFGEGVDAEFMTLAMNSRYYREQVGEAISGAEGLANNLPLSALRAFRFALPPLAEQRSIVRFLGKALGLVRNASSGAARKASQLREYRTRLIADVVTGKLDVRHAAAELNEQSGTGGIGVSTESASPESGDTQSGVPMEATS